MDDRTTFFTRTMARVQADQGNLEKAAEIYRYLVGQNPEQEELRSELEALEKRIAETTPERLVALFESWLELIFLHNRLQRLRKLERGLQRRLRPANDHGNVAP